VVDNRIIISLVKKTLHNSWPDQEHPPAGRHICVRVNNQENTRVNTRSSRCKTIWKTRLEFSKQHLKKPVQFWNNILWTDETKINLHQNDGKRRAWRREGTAHDSKHTTSSVKHGECSVMAWACMAANGTGSPEFIDNLTADKSSRMNSEVFRAILSAQIRPNASKPLDGASQCRWTMTQSILNKQPNTFLRQRSGMFCNGQVNHLT
jgi:hypothetical protein